MSLRLLMTLFGNRDGDRVMVFIDYRNICDMAQGIELGHIDLYRLTQILVANRQLEGAYVFDAVSRFVSKDDANIKTHDKLQRIGFRVVERRSLDYNRETNKVDQKEVDVSLACEMLEHALRDHYDVAIVVSGDRDFVPVMEKVQAAGKRVEVAALDNNSSFNEECKRKADVFYYLDKLPIIALDSENFGAERL